MELIEYSCPSRATVRRITFSLRAGRSQLENHYCNLLLRNRKSMGVAATTVKKPSRKLAHQAS